MEDLDFEHYRQRYAALCGVANSDVAASGLRRAQDDHSLAVQRALSEARFSAIAMGQEHLNEQARHFIIHGAARRLQMMGASYSDILELIDTDRREPLPQNDVAAVSRDINMIYINILGVLDNYAWCLLHQSATAETKKLHRKQIGLFSAKFMADVNLENLKPMLMEFYNCNCSTRVGAERA